MHEMKKRDLKLGRQRKDLYVNELHKFQRKGLSREEALLDKLLTCALIEARSAERFRLLSLHCADADLRDWYHKFMVSEALHYKMFIELAGKYFGEDAAWARWQEFLKYEAGVMENLPVRGDRMH